MVKQASNCRNRQKSQQTHGMWVSFIDFTCKLFIFRNIYRCKSTIFRSSYYSLHRVQIFKGSSRSLSPSHTTRDAVMNKSLAFSDDVNLGRLCFKRNNSDGKTSLKRQRTPETTTDTQAVWSSYEFTYKCSYFEIFIVVNRPYFVPHTILYNMFEFS